MTCSFQFLVSTTWMRFLASATTKTTFKIMRHAAVYICRHTVIEQWHGIELDQSDARLGVESERGVTLVIIVPYVGCAAHSIWIEFFDNFFWGEVPHDTLTALCSHGKVGSLSLPRTHCWWCLFGCDKHNINLFVIYVLVYSTHYKTMCCPTTQTYLFGSSYKYLVL